MSLGATANALRRARGLSLGDIEKLTGINKGALSKFERSIEGLGQNKLDKLCVVFNTTPSVLYAVARASGKNPDLLADVARLHVTVGNLARLIDGYLQADDNTRQNIDGMLNECIMTPASDDKLVDSEELATNDV